MLVSSLRSSARRAATQRTRDYAQGSLTVDKQGASGLMYRQNGYHDANSGHFTQEDPIGLAGGLNLYGFANGDPVNFSDPFGLWPCGPLNGVCARLAVAWLTRGATMAAAGGAALTDLRAPSGVQANQATGLAAEARVAAQLLEEGNTILGSHVAVRTSAGRRVIDHLIQKPDATLVAVEVKSGGAVRSGQQLLKDGLMEIEGGTLVGKNAPEALRGQTLHIPTVERRP